MLLDLPNMQVQVGDDESANIVVCHGDPKRPRDRTCNPYSTTLDDFWAVPTGEIPLTALHRVVQVRLLVRHATYREVGGDLREVAWLSGEVVEFTGLDALDPGVHLGAGEVHGTGVGVVAVADGDPAVRQRGDLDTGTGGVLVIGEAAHAPLDLDEVVSLRHPVTSFVRGH
jgi:hypothetical protein